MHCRACCILVIAALCLGCGEGDVAAPDATPVTPAVFNTAGAPTVAFSVPDMMCPDSCAVKTKEILAKVPGARDVIVDFDTKTATVAIEEGEFDADVAIAALVDYGFDHSALKADTADAAEADAAPTPPQASVQ